LISMVPDWLAAWPSQQPLTDAHLLELDAAKAAALDDENFSRSLLGALLSRVAQAPTVCHPADLSRSADVIVTRAAFELACSNSGATVQVHGAGGAAERPAVMVLGFAGASHAMLQPTVAMYREQYPSWTVATSVPSGVECAEAEPTLCKQVERLCEVADACSGLMIHTQSNNGYRLWVRLQREPRVMRKVKALIHDCGQALDADFDLDDFRLIVAKICTTSAVVQDLKRSQLGAVWPNLEASIGRFAASAFALREFVSADAMKRDLATAAHVPTLFFTSPTDRVIPCGLVEKFAAAMRAAAPQRPVRLLTLEGRHVRLLDSSRAAYLHAVRQLATESGLVVVGGATATATATPGPAAAPAKPAPAANAPAEGFTISMDPASQPLGTMERVLEIQAEEFAEDLAVGAHMVEWSERRLRAYFEAGGVE